MSRQRGDVHEIGLGPLFSPRTERDVEIPTPARLTGSTDPATSRKAAGEVLADGTAETDAAYLVELVERFPGLTMVGYGAIAATKRGGDAFRWRLKLGRRTGTLQEAGAIHVDGEIDGMATWWPGRRPETLP